MSKSVEFVTGPREGGESATIESVADILERELQSVISEWLVRVEREPDLNCIPLSFEDRPGHLPHLLHDVIARLRVDAGSKKSWYQYVFLGGARHNEATEEESWGELVCVVTAAISYSRLSLLPAEGSGAGNSGVGAVFR